MFINNLKTATEISNSIVSSTTPPKLLRILVSEICNLDCIFCCWKSGYRNDNKCKFSVSDYLFIIKSAILSGAYKRVMLTGGEPLMLENEFLINLVSSISKLRKEGLDSFWLCTNGVLLKEKAATLSNAGLENIDVSIAANNKTTYKSYTKSLKNFDMLFEGIAEAKLSGITTRVSVPIYRNGIDNYEKLFQLIYLVKSAGASSLGYFKLHKTNNNAHVFDDLFFNVNEITEAITADKKWNIENVNGEKRLVDNDGFQVIIPCRIAKITENCTSRNCGDYCQGTYASYITETELQSCHRTFKDNFNSIDIRKMVLNRDMNSLIDIMNKVSKFS